MECAITGCSQISHTDCQFMVVVLFPNSAQLYQVIPENVFLIHDELDYPLGKVSIKKGGSAK